MRHSAIILPLLAMLQGCATVTVGAVQEVSVRTDDGAPAACVLRNGAGEWAVGRTPGAALVHGSLRPLAVSCRGADGSRGYAEARSRLNLPTVGNLAFGGPPGALLDASTGAASAYDPVVTVHMSR
jgi:hypothetical protein